MISLRFLQGSGVEIKTQKLGPGFVQQVQVACSRCGGKGKLVSSVCTHCHGTKVSHEETTHILVIERGMPEGHKISFISEGDQRPDEQPGDIHYIIRSNPHPVFERQGNNLRINMAISLKEALIGFSRTIKHLDGHEVSVKRERITRPGLEIVLKSEGMPVHSDSTQFGDLIVTFTVIFPESISEQQREAFEKLLP